MSEREWVDSLLPMIETAVTGASMLFILHRLTLGRVIASMASDSVGATAVVSMSNGVLASKPKMPNVEDCTRAQPELLDGVAGLHKDPMTRWECDDG